MAAETRSFIRFKLLCLLHIFLFAGVNLADFEVLEEYSLSNISTAVSNGCVLVALQPASNSAGFVSILHKLSEAFKNESRASIGVLTQSDVSSISWKNSKSRDLVDHGGDLRFFPRNVEDRTCLLRPSWDKPPKPLQYHGPRTLQDLLDFINTKCATFRQLDGSLSSAGLERERILENLYRVPNSDDHSHDSGPVNIGSTCDRIPLPSKEKFFHEYFFRSNQL
ncbi:hypothetical protein OS493_038627 [Desmophyllum pertusum]|uniref:Uncharacterized protein n=1 Tax=Desmophyllum pertusum TaxID=174260 RepID=A0A9W9ZJJ7_9CNID|nr:hypothetical protein OS493_038627 [Desmophyllum pertusum]